MRSLKKCGGGKRAVQPDLWSPDDLSAQDAELVAAGALEFETTNPDIRLETYRLQQARAETASRELDKAAGLLVERTEVNYVLAVFIHTLRTLLQSLPDRLAVAIATHRENVAAIHAEIDGVSKDLLNELSETMERKKNHAN